MAKMASGFLSSSSNISASGWVIFMTAKVQPDEIAHFKSLGAIEVIAKPFDPRELCVRVRVGERILSLDKRGVNAIDVARLSAWFGLPGYKNTMLPKTYASV